MRIAACLTTFWVLLGIWVAVFPGTAEALLRVQYSFIEHWGVSRLQFECFALGTLAILATIGFVGTAVGLVLGLLVAYNVEPIRKFLSWITGANLFPSEFYFLSQLPSRVEAHEVLSVVGLALFLSLAATIYPSWRAAKLDPVEALRYE